MWPSWFSSFKEKFTHTNPTTVDPTSSEKNEPVESHVENHDESPGSSLYAVIIGIDKYAHHGQLQGAVNDATKFKEYLIQYHGVPERNIFQLFNDKATRSEIINALMGLITHKSIKEGDPIVIYYSGHGGEIPAPSNRKHYGDKIQCLLPQDADKWDDGVRSSKGGALPIPDFTISAILEEIANNKGNNITVIFDCCHSAGGSRGEEETARAIETSSIPALPDDVDAQIFDRLTGPASANGFVGQAMQSHVLIAACGHSEKAFENGTLKRGYFTLALLEQLCKPNLSLDSLTYEGLMQRIGKLGTINPQNPVCEGNNSHRILFNSKLPGASNSFIAIDYEPRPKTNDDGTIEPVPVASRTYYLQAGAAQGISTGSVYEVYSSPVPGTKNLVAGKLTVEETSTFKARLSTPSFDMPDYPYARQIEYGKQEALELYCTPEFIDAITPDADWEKLFASAKDGFMLHPSEEGTAHVTIGVNQEKTRAIIKIKEQIAIKYKVDQLDHTLPLDPRQIIPALRTIGRWNWHLRRNPVKRYLEDQVVVEFFELKQDRGVGWTPTGNNLNKDGVAEIVVDPVGKYYGLKITNHTGRDLYAYTVYFSINKQETILRFTKIVRNAEGTVEPSLPKAEGSNLLTIGYGSGGTPAIRHFIKDIKSPLPDVGIYKIFLTTEHADFSSLEIPTPFVDIAKDMDTGKEPSPIPDLPLWDTKYLTVVQLGQPILKGSQEGYSEERPLLKAESSTVKREFRAHRSGLNPTTLFKTEKLSQKVISEATAMRLRTLSRQSDPGPKTKSWFRISLLEGDELIRERDDGQPIMVDSHMNERAGGLVALDGDIFTRTHEIWSSAQVGDSFLVEIVVEGKGCHAHFEEGALRIW